MVDTGTATKRKPIELSELFARRERSVAIVFGEADEDRFFVRYRPDRFTATVNAGLGEALAADQIGATADLLTMLISGWDIAEGGEPFPVTRENLESLGLPLMALVERAIRDDFSMGKATSPASDEGSSST
ncbi:MAG TPA: hypothetical protein VH482_02815 [Thermomicrobiales bacterium]